MRIWRTSSGPSTSSESLPFLTAIDAFIGTAIRASIGSRSTNLIPLAGAVADFADAGFEPEVLRAPGTVLVDFWAPWCGPCRLMAPLMDWAADAYADRLSVGKLEVDGNPSTRDQFKVQGIPTLILFREGEEVARHEGAIAKAKLKTFLDAHL